MMKVRLGIRKREESLRPLTEKEIQEKLYGRYQQALGVKAEIEEAFLGPLGRERKLILGGSAKASFSFPWREGLKFLFKGTLALLSFLREVFQKTGRGVWISVLVVGSLFLAVHALNVYRTQGMESPRPPERVNLPPKKVPLQGGTPISQASEGVSVAPTRSTRLETPEASGPSLSGVKPPVATKKPYVIQICTYARAEDAERLVAQMTKAELPAFLQPLRRANGKTFYPVFLGRFETFREAQAKLQEFRGRPIASDFPDSFVRAL